MKSKITISITAIVFTLITFYGCGSDSGGDVTGGMDANPDIASISPTAGMPGTEVTINGTGFSSTASQNQVAFNGTPATVSSASPTRLVTNVPDGATTGAITVTVDGESAEGPTFTVQEADNMPAVNTVMPDSGTPGTQVTITGRNFSPVSSENMVEFNGTPAVVSASTDTTIVTEVPNGATSGLISVTVAGESTNGPVFEVLSAEPSVSSINPESAKFDEIITINGENFSTMMGNNRVFFEGGTFFPDDSLEAVITMASDTILQVEVPEGAGAGNIRVEVEGEIVQGPEFEYIETVEVIDFAGDGLAGSSDGLSENARFFNPTDVVFDAPTFALYVADSDNNTIRKIDLTSTQVTTLTSNTVLSFPSGIAVGSTGDLFVSDFENNRIARVTTSGTITNFSGSGTQGFTDGTNTNASFNGPNGLDFDANGDLYVADALNHAIRVIDGAGNVSTFLGDGTSGGIGTERFNTPTDVELLFTGQPGNPASVFIADLNNDAIRFADQSVTATLAGTGNPGFADGDESTATFNGPYSVVQSPGFSNDFTLYVSDFDNHAIRKVRLLTEENGALIGASVTTLAGTGVQGFTDGDGEVAQFNRPAGMTLLDDEVQRIRFLIVADSQNHSIRILSLR